MTHTSGIPQVERKTKTGATMEEQYQRVADEPMAFQPGTKEEYNNFNFDIVGDLIAKISGSTYISYMTEHVFAPLKMDSTRDNSESDAKMSNRATGYNKTKSGTLKEDDSKVLPTGRAVRRIGIDAERPVEIGSRDCAKKRFSNLAS